MQGERVERVASLIQEALSEIIQKEVKDPRVEWATITLVNMTPDLRNARISISTFSGEERLEQMILTLNKMRGFLQKRLNERIRMKFIPILSFYPDKNIPYAEKIMRRLKEVMPELKYESDES
jgi:ribosome-binding factor A